MLRIVVKFCYRVASVKTTPEERPLIEKSIVIEEVMKCSVDRNELCSRKYIVVDSHLEDLSSPSSSYSVDCRH